jgi:hypothetical protein
MRFVVFYLTIAILGFEAFVILDQAPTQDSAVRLILIAFGWVATLVYFVPTFIAAAREHPNALPILIVNAVFGWSLIGYVVALVWACKAIEPRLTPQQLASIIGGHGNCGRRRPA